MLEWNSQIIVSHIMKEKLEPSGFVADGKYLIKKCPIQSLVIKYKSLCLFNIFPAYSQC